MVAVKNDVRQTIVISLGGSVIVPDEINIHFLNAFEKFISGRDEKFIIVCGGGSTARKYIRSFDKLKGKLKISNDDLDRIGITATRLNAELLRAMLPKQAYPKTVYDFDKKIRFDKVLIASGHSPGWSTDFCSVRFAETFKAKKIINISNIDFLYSKDPKNHKDAEKISEISWKDFLKMTGGKWTPGKNTPFDPLASERAMKKNIEVIIARGGSKEDIPNLRNILNNKPFKGTSIHNR